MLCKVPHSWLLVVTTRQPDFGYLVFQGCEKHMHVSCQDYDQYCVDVVLFLMVMLMLMVILIDDFDFLIANEHGRDRTPF